MHRISYVKNPQKSSAEHPHAFVVPSKHRREGLCAFGILPTSLREHYKEAFPGTHIPNIGKNQIEAAN